MADIEFVEGGYGDTDYNGAFVAQVQLTGSSITKTTKLMSVLAFKKLAS